MRGHHPLVTCTRCGRRRYVRGDRIALAAVCIDCKFVRVEPSEKHALTGGRWVGRAGIQVWEAA